MCRLYLSSVGRVVEVVHLLVDADADEALLARGFEDSIALRLAVADERPKDEQPRLVRKGEDLVHDLGHALALDLVAVGTVRMTDARKEQAHVVVDLSDRADRGARVARGALLVNRDGRRQAVDLVDVRLLHLAQELACVGAQRFDVASLALGVDRVEGQAALARAGQAGDDHEPVARQLNGDVLEVVLARAAHNELFLGHTGSGHEAIIERMICFSA